MNNSLRDGFGRLDRKTVFGEQEYSGVLGVLIGGEKTVNVANRKGYVYVRVRGNSSEIMQVWNDVVSPVYDLPVIVVRDGNKWKIKSRDSERYGDNWSSKSPFLPQHGNAHSFSPEIGGGGDVIWVDERQFLPLLVAPSGTGADSVIISPTTLRFSDGTFRQVGNTGTSSLSMYAPTGSNAAMLLLYADATSGSIGMLVNSGTYFNNGLTGTSEVLPYIPKPGQGQLPLAAIRLVSGTNRIGWDNIYDLRQFFQVGGAGGLGSVIVQDEGVPIASGTVLNFTRGANVTASGTVINVDVPWHIPEGQHLRVGTARPTTSYIGFGDAGAGGPYVKINEPTDDSLGVSLFGFPLLHLGNTSDSFIVSRIGDMGNLEHGNYIDTSASGTHFNHPIYAPNLTGTSSGGTGDVSGPASSVDNAVARFDGVTGKLIQGSLASITDAGTINVPAGQTYNVNGSAHAHDWSTVTNKPVTFPPDLHTHSAGEIVSGTFPLSRLPIAADGVSNSTQIPRADDTRLSNARQPLSHVHTGAEIVSGTLPAARLPAPTISTLGGVMRNVGTVGHPVSGIGANGELLFSAVGWADVTGKPTSFTPTAHVHSAADVTSGTFADARVAVGNVTQHQAALSIGWGQITGVPTRREVLTANRTYFVRTDGNNANTGLVDSAAGAFLTIQHAVTTAANLDRANFDVTIQVGSGTYNIGTSQIVLREGVGQNRIFITGNVTTPANVIIQSGAGVTAFSASGISTQYEIRGFRFIGTDSHAAINSNYGAVTYYANCEFGTGFAYHIESTFGGMNEAVGNYTIIGGTTNAHISARGASARLQSRTVTLTGTPNFPTGFVEARYSATIFITGNTFSGAATGPRFHVDLNAVVQSLGATLPGSVAGTTATGGHYV